MKELSKSATKDLQLVNAIRGENRVESERAFSSLFNKYHDSMLFHFKGLVGGDEEIARELVSQAFIKVSSNIEKFNEESAVFSTWLFTMTKNLFIDNLRKKKESLVSITDLSSFDEESHIVEYDVISEDGNPEEKMLERERNKKMNEIISSMKNVELREVVKMRYFDGLSYEQISEQTARPIGTVKAFLFRSREILRDEFTKCGISM
jgi:RNA polymerase sigma factor (sigma-70 family)